MDLPTLDDDTRDDLVDRLATALDGLFEQTCLDMGPLWLEATRQQRKPLGSRADRTLGFDASERYYNLSKGLRSRYRALATWRHACLANDALDAEFREALVAIYFTPYPDNAPPYAWSRAASDAPDAHRFPSPTTLRERARSGAHATVMALLDTVRALDGGGTYADEVWCNLVRTGCRATLYDLLKLEDFPTWEQP